VSVVCGMTAHGMCGWFKIFESSSLSNRIPIGTSESNSNRISKLCRSLLNTWNDRYWTHFTQLVIDTVNDSSWSYPSPHTMHSLIPSNLVVLHQNCHGGRWKN